jgi:hypothetical protein
MTKRDQYFARRAKGRTPEDSAARTHLSRTSAHVYEAEYLTDRKAKRASVLKAQMQERVDYSKRVEDDTVRAAAFAKKPAVPLPPDEYIAKGGSCTRGAYDAYLQSLIPAENLDPPIPRFEDDPSNGGLPYDFIRGLQETAYQDSPVEEGIWSPEHGFQSRSDLLETAFRERHKNDFGGW